MQWIIIPEILFSKWTTLLAPHRRNCVLRPQRPPPPPISVRFYGVQFDVRSPGANANTKGRIRRGNACYIVKHSGCRVLPRPRGSRGRPDDVSYIDIWPSISARSSGRYFIGRIGGLYCHFKVGCRGFFMGAIASRRRSGRRCLLIYAFVPRCRRVDSNRVDSLDFWGIHYRLKDFTTL